MPYDLFISYSRRDNKDGRVTELVEHIGADYLQFSGKDLSYFLDKHDIHGMDHWRHRILGALRESRLFLVCLSPAYLESEYCAWEFNEYLNHEIARALLGEGVAPVYFVDVDGWGDRDFENRCPEWVKELRRRQYVDLRPWFHEGEQALRDASVRDRMAQLKVQIHDRLDRINKSLEAKGNVDRHNEHFQGRKIELRRLREQVGLGKVGVLTAVHGLGGMGKTALATEYAHAFAHEYSAGRWQIRCEGRDDLRAAFVSLAGVRDFEFEFSEDEKKNLDLGFERVLRELEKRARSTTPSRVLVILDNVDQPTLLAPAQVAKLPRAEWLHLIATTRLGESDLFGTQQDRTFLPVDELPEADALDLLASFQPGRSARDADDREAAREIVNLLGRFPLAVEAAAVYFGQVAADVTCAGFRDRLKAEGLTGLEGTAKDTSGATLHGETSLRITLRPTLERLDEPARLALAFAALLPADHVALPWLRALMAQRFPELGRDAAPGYPDKWQSLLRRLFSLLQPTGVRDAQGAPLVARIHRLVQEVVRLEGGDRVTDLEPSLLAHILARALYLWDCWVRHEHRWEVAPLTACADHWLERDGSAGPWLASTVAGPLQHLGTFAAAERLNRRAVERMHPGDPNYAACLNNRALLLHHTNRLTEAEPLFRRALEIWEKSLGQDHPQVATAFNNLAALLQAANRPTEAEPLYRRALAIDEASYGPDHPDVARDLNNLAALLQATNRLTEAEPLCQRALVIDEESYGPDHPHVARDLNNLAALLQATNRPTQAEPLFLRALAIDEESYGPAHPNVAIRLNNLAGLLQATNRLIEAEPLSRRHLEIFLQFGRATGHEHLHLSQATKNYAGLLEAMGQTPEQIRTRLGEIGRPFGVSLGGGALPGSEQHPGGSVLGALGQLARKLFGRLNRPARKARP